MRPSPIAVTILALTAALPALAAGPTETPAQSDVTTPGATPKPQLTFTLRGGLASTPEYFGADTNEIDPDFGFDFHSLTLRNGRTLGNLDPWAEPLGLTFGGSLRYIDERDASDFDALAGLEDIDPALELGVSLRYGTERFAAFGALRRGFGGHEGWVGELGADAISRPTDNLRLSLGPRLLFGDDTYNSTYFGISPTETSTNLPAYDPEAGLVSAGVAFGARYQINEVWGLEGAVTWDSLRNDAADSPIVQQGSDEQWGMRFGVTRVFSIGG